MARQRKQVLLDGVVWQKSSGKSGRYFNTQNPDQTISRRQAEKPELAKSGFKSFEQKVKARAAAGIPKGFKQHKYKAFNEKTFYRKRVYNIADLKEELAKIDEDRYIVSVKARGKFARDGKTGLSLLESGHTLQGWQMMKAGNATSDYYLKFVDFGKHRRESKEQGFLVNAYEINITAK